jgi:hypothetical protein
MDQRSDEQRERHEGLMDGVRYSIQATPSTSELQRQIKVLEERVKRLEDGNRSR